MRSLTVGLMTLLVVGASISFGSQQEAPAKKRKVVKTEREWQKSLTRDQFLVSRMKETEPAYSGRYVNNHAKGYYACVGCGAFLFSSATKFDSGTGWPSFWRPIDPKIIDTEIDYKLGEPRTEVMCNDCGGHLGHVFNDGPAPTGLRFCMNSVALRFLTEAQAKAVMAKQKAQEKKDAEKTEAPPKDGEKPATDPAKTATPK